MADTNEFASFRCTSICTGGGPESGRKNFEKCLPAGTGTKIYFSRSVNFFDFSQGNLKNFVGNLERVFRGFFLTHRTRLKKFGENFGAFFVRKFVPRQKIFRAKFTLQTCHLIINLWGFFWYWLYARDPNISEDKNPHWLIDEERVFRGGSTASWVLGVGCTPGRPENLRCNEHGVMWAAAQIIYLNSCQSRFSGVCISFYRCFGTFGPPIRKLLAYTGMLPCLVPSWPQSMQLRFSFRSRSGCWPCLGFSILSRFSGVYLSLLCFRSGVAPANQTKERPVHEPFPGAFRNKNSMWIVLVFLRKKHQNSQKWVKFMNFSLWPFLWFGLPGRLLIRQKWRLNVLPCSIKTAVAHVVKQGKPGWPSPQKDFYIVPKCRFFSPSFSTFGRGSKVC